jgi:hypothetical protein
MFREGLCMKKYFKPEFKCKYCGGERSPRHSFFNSHECCLNCFTQKKYQDDPKYAGTGFAKNTDAYK